MDINSNDSYEEEFDSSEFSGKQSIFPSRNQAIIILLICIVLTILFEKIFISSFLYIIPSYIFLIITWFIIHLILIRILLFIFIFPGKNSLVNFYLRSVFGKIRAKSFNYSLEHFQNRIDKILLTSKNFDTGLNHAINPTQINKSKVSSKYLDIYEKIKEKYIHLNSYENEFLNKLLSFKTSIENSSLQENFTKYSQKEQIIITEKDYNDYENIKNEAKQIQQLLNDYRGDIELGIFFQNTFKYLKNIFLTIF
jgi:hypothetical protein